MTRLRRHEFTRASLVKLAFLLLLAPLLIFSSCDNFHRLMFRYWFLQALGNQSTGNVELAYTFLVNSLPHAGKFRDPSSSLGFCLTLSKQNYAEASSFLDRIEDADLGQELSYYLSRLSPAHRSPLPFSELKTLGSRTTGGALVLALEYYRQNRRAEAKEYLTRVGQSPLLPLSLLTAYYEMSGKIEYLQRNFSRAEMLLSQSHRSFPSSGPAFINWEYSLVANHLFLGQTPSALDNSCSRLAAHLEQRGSLISAYHLNSVSGPQMQRAEEVIRNALGYLYLQQGNEPRARDTLVASVSLPIAKEGSVNQLNLALLDLRNLVNPSLPPENYEGREARCLEAMAPDPEPDAWLKKLPPLSAIEQGSLLNNCGILLYRRAARERQADRAEQAVRYLTAALPLSSNHDLTSRNKEEAEMLLKKLRLAQP